MRMNEDINNEVIRMIKTYKQDHHATTHTAALKCCIRYDRMLDIENGRTVPKHSEVEKIKKLAKGAYDNEEN